MSQSSGLRQRTHSRAISLDIIEIEQGSQHLEEEEEPSDEFLGKLQDELEEKKEWRRKWIILFTSLLGSGAYMLLGYFFPVLQNIPIFSWIGLPAATDWNWTLVPSLGYVGQGKYNSVTHAYLCQ